MKQTLILLGVLAALIAVIMVSNRVSATREKPEFFKGFNKSKVSRISISRYGSNETLKKEDGKWFATQNGDYPADSAKINIILNFMADQKKDDPISKNPAKHSELKVDSINATKVIVESGPSKVVFLYGSMAQGFSGNYLRFDGKNEVYVSKGGMEQVFNSAPNFYRSKVLFALNKDNITGLSVIYKPNKDSAAIEFSAQFNVEKAVWKIDKPETIDGDGSRMNDYLAKFCGLEVDEWYDKDTTTALGFDNPILRASLKKSDGSTISLLAGAEKNGNRYVKVEGDNNKYILRSGKIDALKPSISDLKAKPAAPSDTASSKAKPVLGFPQGK